MWLTVLGMAITLEQIRTRDAQRRADAAGPDPDPSSSPYPFEPRFDLHGIADGQTVRYDEASRSIVPADAGAVGGLFRWTTGASYTQGQVVTNDGALYQAVDDHTAGATFSGDSAHWTQLDSETDALALAQLSAHISDSTGVHGIADTAALIVTGDARLSNARVPTAHKTTHATGGTDPLSPADIGAATAASVTSEAAARASGDSAEATARAAAIGVEATTRADADDAETAARIAADTSEATTRAAADTAETAARIAADAAKADLVSGKVPTSQLPALATGEWVTVANQAAMLALTSSQVQVGDGAIRSDQAGRRWLLADPDPSVLGHWIQLETPDAVTTVNGQAGTVVLGAADVGAPTTAALTSETAARTSADSTESAARIAADSAEATARASADTAEATARGNAVALKADIASPTFTGSPKAPTKSPGDNSTNLASTAYADAAAAAATGKWRVLTPATLGATANIDAAGKPFVIAPITLSADCTATVINAPSDGLLLGFLILEGASPFKLTVNGIDIPLDYGAGKPSMVQVWFPDGSTPWLTGQRGDTGANGGPITIPYTFSTTITDADPGNGHLRLDNATQASATKIRADLLDSFGGDVSAILATFADSTNPIKGHIKLQNAIDATKWLVFTVSAIASPSGYKNITVAYVSGPGGLVNGDTVLLMFARAGDAGVSGMTQATADGRYLPQIPGVCQPADGLHVCTAANVAPGANAIRTRRIIVPKDGFLRDVSVWLGTSSGNIILAVYDVGAASSGVRTKLWDSGSVAMATGSQWQVIDPGASAIPVVAGQHLDLMVMADNGTATLGKIAGSVTATSMALPPNFGVVGGCLMKFATGWAPGSFAMPATVSEVTAALTTTIHALTARVA